MKGAASWRGPRKGRRYMTTQGKNEGVNPKDAIASAKPDLSLVTRAMAESIAAALQDGVAKYGRNNWRSTPVRALVYTAAAVRHIKAYEDGEDFASDSGVHHLDHAIASLAIMRDAAAFGTLVDNRELGTRLAAAAPPATPAPAKRYGVFYRDAVDAVVPSASYGSDGDCDLDTALNLAGAGNQNTVVGLRYFVKELP
jgi:hypothetical protein